MDWNWMFFVIGLWTWPILKVLALAINRAVIEHRQKRFLKFVNVTFPDKDKITFISLDTSDKRAMAKLERQIREQYDFSEEDQDSERDRIFDGGSSRTTSRRRSNPPR